MKPRILLVAVLGIVLGVLVQSPLMAQWTGEVGAGYVWQTSTGNEGSFLTQYGQRQGFLLEDFNLAYAPKQGGQVFALNASGFGSAEPAQHADLMFKACGGWTFKVAYDRQMAFFRWAGADWAQERGQGTIERWKGAVAWDGWSAARLTLNLRYTQKRGTLYRPIYGQNNAFPIRDNFDQDMKEASIKIETKTLPVYLSFEQAYARYDQADRWSPAAPGALFPPSNSSLVGLSTPREAKTTLPTSRLIAAYGNEWVDLAGSVFYSRATMDSAGTRMTVYDAAGGAGQFQWINGLDGSVKQDTKAANVDADFKLGGGWSIRASGDYHNATADSNIMGANILRLGKPGGTWTNIVQTVNDSGFMDVKDTIGKVEVVKRGDGWAAWAGFQGASRGVSWQRQTNADPSVDRHGNGWFVGGSWSRTPALRINMEYTRGTFSNYIFKTDPDLVQRFDCRVVSRLGGGWNLGAWARWEEAENPPAIADLRHQNQGAGARFGWASKDGNSGFGLSADILQLDALSSTILPDGRDEVLPYHSDALSLTANGFFSLGPVHINADLTKVRDGGSTWPLTTWGGAVKAAIDGPNGTQFVVFGQYRSYVEESSSLDNYYARRYGVIIRWRF